MAPLQCAGRLFHESQVQLLSGAPDVSFEEGGRFPFLRQKMAIGFSIVSAPHGKIHIHFPAGSDADVIGEAGIHGIKETVPGNGGFRVEGAFLSISMDSGVRAGHEVKGGFTPVSSWRQFSTIPCTVMRFSCRWNPP